MLPELPDGIATAGRLSHQLHVGLTIDDGGNPLV
jgi:hypothetical protein